MTNPWKKIRENLIYENKFGYKLREDDVITPGGKEGKYMVLESKGYVQIVAITSDKKVIMVRQWRYPIDEESLEVPTGGIEGEENPIETAKRELDEEVGVKSADYQKIGEDWVGSGALKVKGHLVLATNVILSGDPHTEETEVIKTELYPFSEVVEKIMTGEINDDKTIIGILMVKEFLQKANRNLMDLSNQ